MLEQAYHEKNRRKWLMIAAGIVFTLAAAYVFTTIGMREVSPAQTIAAIEQ